MFIYDFSIAIEQFQLGMVWVALELNTPNWGEQSEFRFHLGAPSPGAPHRVLEDSSTSLCVARHSHGVLQPGLPGATDPQPPGFTIGAAKMGSLAPKLDVTRCTPDAHSPSNARSLTQWMQDGNESKKAGDGDGDERRGNVTKFTTTTMGGGGSARARNGAWLHLRQAALLQVQREAGPRQTPRLRLHRRMPVSISSRSRTSSSRTWRP